MLVVRIARSAGFWWRSLGRLDQLCETRSLLQDRESEQTGGDVGLATHEPRFIFAWDWSALRQNATMALDKFSLLPIILQTSN